VSANDVREGGGGLLVVGEDEESVRQLGPPGRSELVRPFAEAADGFRGPLGAGDPAGPADRRPVVHRGRQRPAEVVDELAQGHRVGQFLLAPVLALGRRGRVHVAELLGEDGVGENALALAGEVLVQQPE
jgi:hypothetical protein